MSDLLTILYAAIVQLQPHCYAAHVPGRGYVNRGDDPQTRPDFDRQYARAAAAEMDNLRHAPGYAEPGYTQPQLGVLLANWNLFPRDIDRTLEDAGYAIEWSDEWIECDECQRVFRTCADSFCWQPAGQTFEADRECLSLCVDCLQEWAQGNRPDDADADQDGGI